MREMKTKSSKHRGSKDVSETSKKKGKKRATDTITPSPNGIISNADGADGQPEKRKATVQDLERKREKNRLNKQKKRHHIAQQKKGIAPEGEGKAREFALSYLRLWKSSRDSWRFMKVRQTWLIKHMFRAEKVTSPDFEILLEYLYAVQGRARALVLEKGQKLVDSHDGDESSKSMGDDTKTVAYSRARQVIQMLV